MSRPLRVRTSDSFELSEKSLSLTWVSYVCLVVGRGFTFKRWLDLMVVKLLPKDPLRKAVQYYLNHWTALTRFLDDSALPLDNNFSERLLRSLALGRNNWLFAGNTEAAHRTAVLMGIIATCRLQGVEPMAYMTWVFNRLGTRRKLDGHSASDSTPAAFMHQAV